MSTTDSFAPARMTLSRGVTSLLAVILESTAIIGVSVVAGALYTYVAHGTAGEISHYVVAGILVAWGFALPFVVRDEYRIEAIVEGRRDLKRLFMVWTGTFLLSHHYFSYNKCL